MKGAACSKSCGPSLLICSTIEPDVILHSHKCRRAVSFRHRRCSVPAAQYQQLKVNLVRADL